MPAIDRYFEIMMEEGGSDLHLMEGQPPKIRAHGEVVPIASEILTQESLGNMMKEICEEKRWINYLQTGDIDFAYALGDKARFVPTIIDKTMVLAVFSGSSPKILTLEQLKSPEVLKRFANFKSGIILVWDQRVVVNRPRSQPLLIISMPTSPNTSSPSRNRSNLFTPLKSR